MGSIVVTWLVFMLVFFLVLYNVIRSAFDSSNLARDIQEIKETLNALKNQSRQVNHEEELEEENEILDEECPACGCKVKQNETQCPDCGLKLIES